MSLALASRECAVAADAHLVASDEAARLKTETLSSLRREWVQSQGDTRGALGVAMQALNKGKWPETGLLPDGAVRVIERFRAASARAAQASSEFQEAYKAAARQTSSVLREIAQSESFREALVWQNRAALHTGIAVLLRRPLGDGTVKAKERQIEELISNYVQRYCTKNETIGFFGPVGWAKFADRKEAMSARPGPNSVVNRRVYFEGWCIDALAEALSENQALWPWLAPRKMPYVRVEGNVLHHPMEAPAELSHAYAAILRHCDGERTARDIARDLLGDDALELRSEDEVYEALSDLRDKRLIAWTLDLPVELHPEHRLRQLLERVEDEALRTEALDMLETLEAARARIAQASGDSVQLNEAVGALEDTFTRITSKASTRLAGKCYAGRTLVYEDCRRDIEVDFGQDMLDTLGPPLSLLLDSARWLTCALAGAYRDAFDDLYRNVARRKGTASVEFTDMWYSAQRHFFGATTCLVDKVLPQFQQRWRETLDLPEGEWRVSYTTEELRPKVRENFAAPRRGWQSAGYHSPDVMLAATSPEAVNSGDYQLVMGELHIGVNTLSSTVFVTQYETPDTFFERVQVDLPAPRIIPVTPKFWPKQTARTFLALITDKDYRMISTLDHSGAPPSRTLQISDLVVEQGGEGLVIKTRDGRLSFDIIDFFGETLNMIVGNAFKLMAHDRHTPRVTIDKLVVARESWSFHPSEIEFAFEMDAAARFAAARRWAQQHGMPRFVFYRVPNEVKPLHMDFESPIYVSSFAKAMRRTLKAKLSAPSVTVSEMIPQPDRLWLPDSEGNRYTSELRIIALDPRP
ncbi:MAG TPA: lantibiotic dehydratase [Pyrinomonadaceae bacterium]|nr:lantibiotic dehydratase [Pyrinomonadaceae bacterium]